jgi:hypothetical protein
LLSMAFATTPHPNKSRMAVPMNSANIGLII